MAGDWDNTDTSWKDMGSSQGEAGSSGYRRPFDMPSNSSSYTNDQSSFDGQQTSQNFDSTYSQIGADVYQPPASSNRASDQTAGQQQPTQEQQQGRATYGGVAPSALNLPPLDAQSPLPYANPNGGRAGYGDVAPPARQLPPLDNTGAGAGTGAGTGNSYPGAGEQWTPSPNQLPGGSGDVAGGVGANGNDPLPATGANFTDGAQMPTADNRLNATNSLNMQLNYPRHYLEGALGGAIGANASSIASGLDKVAGNFPDNRLSTSWSNWRANSAAASPGMEAPKTAVSPNATAEGAPAPQPNRGTAAWNSFKSPNSLPAMERTMRGAGWGVAGVTAGLVANNYIDKAFGKEHNLSGPQFWEGPAMAAAALAPRSTGGRILGMAGVAVASNVIGDKLPLKNDGTYSTLMQPNWVDSLGLGFAAAMPGGLTKKALTYGAAYAGARGLNALEAMPFVDAPGVHEQGKNQKLNDELVGALDSTKVTADSFNNIVDKTTKLGFENEGAMSVQSADFLNKQHDPLTHMHGAAALYTGVGDVWMERGTKLKTKSLDTDSRILAGKNYDLGGQATGFYRKAYTNINEGMNQTEKDSDQYKELEKSEKAVSERLDKIYGKHEIQPLFDELKEAYRQNLDPMTHYYTDLKSQVFGLQTQDTQYAAKMCRDLALLSMSIASYKADHNEGGGAQTLYADAAQALDAAKRIDGEHPDLKQLEQIASKVLPATDKASENQWNSNFNEPFDVNNDGK